MSENEKGFFYKSFGFTIRSEILLPELIPHSLEKVKYDVGVVISDLTSKWSSVKKSGFFVENNLVMFEVPDTAIFCIKNGNQIIVSPIKGSEEDKIRLYILGTCMGILLMKRKILALHGSAIEIDGKAYAFIGESGAGKSTLASTFIRKGYRLLSDDIIPISLLGEGIPYVIPSYPQQKLWQESLDHFGVENIHYRPLFDRETKFAVPVHSNFLDRPLQLSGVFELVKSPNDRISLNDVQGLECFRMFFHHTFRSILIPRLGLTEWHFNESAKILKEIDCFNIQRPAIGFTAPELLTHILEKIRKESNQYA